MCAIFGFGFAENHKLKDEVTLRRLLIRLMHSNAARGRMASGLAFTQMNEEIAVMKSAHGAESFTGLETVRNFINNNMDLSNNDGDKRLSSILGHCRLKTKGTERVNHNNHPILAKEVVGVHNGSIGNDEILFDSYKDVPYIERAGEVDSEIIFRLVDYYANFKGLATIYAIKETANRLTGGYACAFVNAWEPHKLFLFRNWNPIALRYYREVGLIVFASLEGYIDDAMSIVKFGDYEKIEILEDRGVEINLASRNITRFKLKVGSNLISSTVGLD